MQERRSNADRRAQTRQALLETARPLFAEKGFAATGTPEVVAQAGVTRGALYHHFADKAALFEAVIEADGVRSLKLDVPLSDVFAADDRLTTWAVIRVRAVTQDI